MRIHRFITTLLGITLLASGCVVLSVHPYYSKSQAKFDESLVGQWDDGNGEIWEFTKHEDNRYLITITEEKVVGIMEGVLFDAGGYTFMDMYPWDFEYTQVIEAMEVLGEAFGDADTGPGTTSGPPPENISDMDLWWNNMHLLPTHSVLRVVKKDPDTIQLALMDVDWLGEQLEENPGLVKHEVLNDEDDDKGIGILLLTAATHELQQFTVKYADNEDAFELDTLVRVK